MNNDEYQKLRFELIEHLEKMSRRISNSDHSFGFRSAIFSADEFLANKNKQHHER